MKSSLLRRLSILAAYALVMLLPIAANASLVRVDFSGIIKGVADTTGLNVFSGSGISANVSTFTGSFDYDTSVVPYFNNGVVANYSGASALSITIDGQHTITSFGDYSGNSISIKNNDQNFNDSFDLYSRIINSPFQFNSNDSFFRFTLSDSSKQVFSSTALPSELVLADFTPRTDNIFIRTDINRSANLKFL